MSSAQHWTATYIATTLAILARACILLAFSEFIFFNEGPVRHFLEAGGITGQSLHIGELILFYCLPGALLLALEPLMTSWPRIVLAGAFVGWSIESAMVPVAYENIPLNLFWTSVSWHALIDVGIGWLVLRRVFASDRSVAKIAASVALGGLTALWSTWSWSELALEAAQFGEVMALIVGLLLVGYGLAGWKVAQAPLGQTGVWIAIAINIAFWALWAVMFLPVSLALLALAVFTAFCLWRTLPAGPTTPVASQNPLGLCPMLLAIPAGVLGFLGIQWTGLSAEIGELLVICVAFGGVLVYAAAVLVALRNRTAR